MRVTTSVLLPAAPSAVFPLLYDSRLEGEAPLILRVGAPVPRACRLVAGRGEGARRQCVTSKGVIDQRVTEWREGEVLAFEMERENAGLRGWVRGMRDRFTLEARGGGTLLTRTSDLEIAGWFAALKAAALAVMVKRIHRYVFDMWGRRLRAATA
ncbi:MAG TPA: SRPBCC family protein [Planctomycetota bacterium]|nr:SRPBCC family protein [Planctomycetota bacterium]